VNARARFGNSGEVAIFRGIAPFPRPGAPIVNTPYPNNMHQGNVSFTSLVNLEREGVLDGEPF
jgi:hypothetical protein